MVGERRNKNNTPSPPQKRKKNPTRICLKVIQNDWLVQIMNLYDMLYIYDSLKKLIHFGQTSHISHCHGILFYQIYFRKL